MQSALERYGMTIERAPDTGCHLISENYAYALQLILGFAALAGLVVSIKRAGSSSKSIVILGNKVDVHFARDAFVMPKGRHTPPSPQTQAQCLGLCTQCPFEERDCAPVAACHAVFLPTSARLLLV